MPNSLGQQVERLGDRRLLEVVAEAPVAEHLEDGEVACCRRPRRCRWCARSAARRHSRRPAGCGSPEQVRRQRVHAGRREQHVVGRRAHGVALDDDVAARVHVRRGSACDLLDGPGHRGSLLVDHGPGAQLPGPGSIVVEGRGFEPLSRQAVLSQLSYAPRVGRKVEDRERRSQGVLVRGTRGRGPQSLELVSPRPRFEPCTIGPSTSSRSCRRHHRRRRCRRRTRRRRTHRRTRPSSTVPCARW